LQAGFLALGLTSAFVAAASFVTVAGALLLV
jgi:hypothetical protein